MSESAMAVLLAAISGIFGGLMPGLIAALYGRRKARADAADIITQASGRAVELVQGQLEEMCLQFDELDKKYRSLKRAHDTLRDEHDKLQSAHDALSSKFDSVLTGAHQLHAQVISLNGIPIYNPPERRNTDGMEYPW